VTRALADNYVPPPRKAAWLETAALCLLLPLAGLAFRRADPFFLTTGFCLPLFLPLLVGLRYGRNCAVILAVGYAILYVAACMYGMTGFAMRGAYVIFGMGLAGYLAGGSRDSWERRFYRTGVLHEAVQRRMDEFTRAYHILKVSHDELESRMAASQHTLRHALLNLRRIIHESGDPLRAFYGYGGKIAEILSESGNIRGMALLKVAETGTLILPPEMILGQIPPVRRDEQMIEEAIRSGKLVSADPDLPMRQDMPLLAIPLTDISGRVWGLAAVYDMAFMSFTEETMNLLAVVGGHIGDILAASSGIAGTCSLENDSNEFNCALRRAIEDYASYHVPSTVLGLWLPKERSPLFREALTGTMRGLDCGLYNEGKYGPVFMLLMPLTDKIGAQGYISRISRMLRERVADPPPKLGVAFLAYEITGEDADAVMSKFTGMPPEDNASVF
jgi:hypothetical protein